MIFGKVTTWSYIIKSTCFVKQFFHCSLRSTYVQIACRNLDWLFCSAVRLFRYIRVSMRVWSVNFMFFPVEIVLNKNNVSPFNKYGNSVKIAALTLVMYVALNFPSVFEKAIVLGKNSHNFIVPVFSKEHRLSFRLLPVPHIIWKDVSFVL